MELALKTLKQLNSINRSKLIVPFEEFYIEILSQHISIEKVRLHSQKIDENNAILTRRINN